MSSTSTGHVRQSTRVEEKKHERKGDLRRVIGREGGGGRRECRLAVVGGCCTLFREYQHYHVPYRARMPVSTQYYKVPLRGVIG